MSPQVKKWGSVSILSTLGGTIIALLFTWVFSTTFTNTVKFTPLIAAIDSLNESVKTNNIRNSEEHTMIVEKLHGINSRININETKLHRVVLDCSEARYDIKNCQGFHE